MALSERLAIIISANGAQAMAEFNKVGKSAERSLATTEQRAQRLGAQFTRVGAGAVVFGAVLAAGMFKAAQAAGEQEAANLRLENTMANQPALAGASAQAFYDQASALQLVTRFGDEATVSAQSQLGVFGLTQDQIMELIPLVQDYAAKSGTDLVTAARNVGKATDGTNTTLKRAGVQFNETAYAADNFAGTVQALQGYAGGFAEREGKTLAGQIEILKNRFGELAEGLGGGAAKAFGVLGSGVGALADGFDSLNPKAQSLVGELLTFGSVGLAAGGGLLFLAGQAIKVASGIRAMAAAATTARVEMTALTVTAAANPMFLALAATAGLAAVALSGFAEDQQSTKASTDAFTESIRSQGDAFAGLAAAVDSLDWDEKAASGDELTQAMEAAGLTADDLRAALTGSEQDLDSFAQQLASTGMVTDQMVGSWDAFKNAMTLQPTDETTSALDRTRAALDHLKQSADTAIAAQQIEAAVFGDTAAAASGAGAAIDELAQDIQDYLNGTFDLPEAQRELRESFDKLWQTVADPEHTADDTAAALQGIAEAAGGVVSAGGPANETLLLTVGRLREAKAAGMITREEFRLYRAAILNIPPGASTSVTTPGLTSARGRTIDYHGVVVSVPTNWSSSFSANTGSAIADVQALIDRIHVLNATVVSPGGVAGRIGAIDAQLNVGESVSVAVPSLVMQPGVSTVTGSRRDGGQSSAPTIIVVSSVDKAMDIAGVRPDQRARVRRRMLAGAR